MRQAGLGPRVDCIGMSRIDGGAPTSRLADLREEAERSALEALIAIERVWKSAHPSGEPIPGRWGEGPSRVRLADLGFDARLRTLAIVGLCPRHAEFFTEWTGLLADRLPEQLRCERVDDGRRCELHGLVMGLARAAPGDPNG